MTTALPPNAAYSTPPNRHSSPQPVQRKENTVSSLQAIPGQTLTKTIKVFLDANLAEISDPSKKINGKVEQIPSINEILKLIVERKEDIIREESPDNVQDLRCLFQSIAKIKDSPFSSSLVNFQLLDALFGIAHKVGDFQLSTVNKTNKAGILTYCALLNFHYRLQGGENSGYFYSRNHDLLAHFLKHDT